MSPVSKEPMVNKCREVLKWYRSHQYLKHAQNSHGVQYRRVDKEFTQALAYLPVEAQFILSEWYLKQAAAQDTMEQLALSETQYYRHKANAVGMLVDVWGTKSVTTWHHTLIK